MKACILTVYRTHYIFRDSYMEEVYSEYIYIPMLFYAIIMEQSALRCKWYHDWFHVSCLVHGLHRCRKHTQIL